MANHSSGTVHSESPQGVAADHSEVYTDPFRVAPTGSAKDTKNTIKRMVVPRACWTVGDICFDFDRAIVKRSARKAFEELEKLCELHKDAPISIFGHADPVGVDEYNKELSEKRARAVYAVLIRDVDGWIDIHKSKGDKEYLQQALKDAQQDPGGVDGVIGSKTRAAILAHMDYLAGKFKLEKKRFLGEGKFAYQGCSEFNPVRMFSKKQHEAYRKATDKAERNEENQLNRRVIAYLFAPGVKVTEATWPCRPASDGIQVCLDRFFHEWKQRRSFQDKPDGREHGAFPTTSRYSYAITEDTFACRFYYLLAHMSPCEEIRKLLEPIRLAFEDGTWTLSPRETLIGVTIDGEERTIISWEDPHSGRSIQFGGEPTGIYKPGLERMEKDAGGAVYALGPDMYGNEPTHLVTLHLDGKMGQGTGQTHFRLVASVKDAKAGAILFTAEVSAQDLWDRSGVWVVSGGGKDRVIERRYEDVAKAKGIWYGGKFIAIEELKYREVKANDNLETKLRDLYQALRGGQKSINERIKAEAMPAGS